MRLALIVLLASCVLESRASTSPDTFLTSEVDGFIDSMVKTHEAAFVSSCRVLSGSTTYVASIVFFPRKNRGMFVQHIVSNDAGVI
jgi:hypothetical protein